MEIEEEKPGGRGKNGGRGGKNGDRGRNKLEIE